MRVLRADGLKKIETDAKAAKEMSSETRIRVNMHNTLTVKFLDLMTTYQEAQVRVFCLFLFLFFVFVVGCRCVDDIV